MRRALHIAVWTLGSTLLLLVLLATSILIVANTSGGRILIERAVASFSGGEVRLAGLAGRFPQAIGLGQLELSDANGVWLTAEGLSLRWSPLALLGRQVKIGQLHLARLDIERRPKPKPGKSGGGSPPQVDLRQLSIERLELAPELTGTRVSLTVRGELHFRSLLDAAAQLAAHRTNGQGDYVLSARLTRQRMDASLILREPAGGPLENLLGYPGLGPLSVQATLSGPRDADQLVLNGRAGALLATVRGTLDLGRQSADLGYEVGAPAMTPRATLSWKRVSLRGHWRGPVRSARADAQLELSGLETPGGVGMRAVEAVATVAGGTLSVRVRTDGLTLPGPEGELLAQAPLRIEAAMHLQDAQRPLQLEARHPLFTLRAHVATAVTPQATFDLRLPDVEPLAAIARQKIAGSAELRGSIRRDGMSTRFEVQGDGALGAGATAVGTLFAGASHLRIDATLTRRSLELERLTLSAPRLSVSASGSAERGSTSGAPLIRSLHASYRAGIVDVSALAPALGGTVTAEGSVDGQPEALAARMRLVSSLSVRDAPRETVEAHITARGLPTLADLEVAADGRFDGAPLSLDAALERAAADAFHVTIRRAEWKSARINGELVTPAKLAAGHGTLQLRIGRLADLQSLSGVSLAGSIDGNLELRPARGRTDARVRLEGHNLVAANVPASLLLTGTGSTDALRMHLSARSANVHGEPASLDSELRLDLDARVLGLERAQMRYHGQTLHLLAPARVSFAGGLAVNRLELGMQRAVLTLEGRLSPSLDVHASVRHVGPSLINAFIPDTLAEGNLDAEAHLEGRASAPSGVVTASAKGVRFANAAARDLHALDLRASAQLLGASVRLDGQLSAGRTTQLTLAGTAPLAARELPMDLKLTGKLDAALANPMLEAQGRRAAGTVAVNAAVGGAPGSPQLSGTLDLADGELRDYVQGVHLSDITAHLVGEHGTMRIAHLTARAAPGEVSMTGTIALLQPKLPIDVELIAKNAQPITSNLLTARLNADVTLRGTLRERLQVAGSIDLRRAVIGIPNSLPANVAVLDVRRPGQAPPAPAAHRLVIGLDLRMHAPREVLVQGRGLNAELGGDLHLGGTSEEPRIEGGFELMRGTFALSGSTLTFTKGEVSFNGVGLRGRIDPTLDFLAQSTVADSTATLHITGLADAPQFELSSTPPLPQDEILARLLFGESAAQLTTLQVAEIGVALASLSGVGGGGPNPLVKVQKALGLDRLSVGSASNASTGGSQSSGTSVEAGRYVSSRVFVGAKQSTTGFSQVEVDVDLSKHLKLQTRLGNGTATTQGTTPENDPGSSLGLTYQFEY
jgi:translocation and assembly module TamB